MLTISWFAIYSNLLAIIIILLCLKFTSLKIDKVSWIMIGLNLLSIIVNLKFALK